MYYYFSSDFPAVLKLNGIYYGAIHNAVKNCKIEGDEPFIEVCPLGAYPPVCFILDSDFLSRPANSVIVTDLKGGYLIKFLSTTTTKEFKVYAQEKLNDAIVTVFCENGNKLSIETHNDFYPESLNFDFLDAEIKEISVNGEKLIALKLLGEKTVVLIYKLSGKIEKVFEREVFSAEFNEKLTTVEKLSDIAKHQITTTWEYSNSRFKAVEKSIKRNQDFNIVLLNDKILPYAFLEELLAGGIINEYLGGIIKDNADKLSGFLGEFIGVIPPPSFRDIDEVGLVYPNGANKYVVDYFKFTVEDKKIINIVKS